MSNNKTIHSDTSSITIDYRATNEAQNLYKLIFEPQSTSTSSQFREVELHILANKRWSKIHTLLECHGGREVIGEARLSATIDCMYEYIEKINGYMS